MLISRSSQVEVWLHSVWLLPKTFASRHLKKCSVKFSVKVRLVESRFCCLSCSKKIDKWMLTTRILIWMTLLFKESDRVRFIRTNKVWPFVQRVLVGVRTFRSFIHGLLFVRTFEHMSYLSFGILDMVTTWFSRIFVSYLPMNTIYRILDCYFLEGFKVLYRVGLAIFQLSSDALLRCRFERWDHQTHCFPFLRNKTLSERV